MGTAACFALWTRYIVCTGNSKTVSELLLLVYMPLRNKPISRNTIIVVYNGVWEQFSVRMYS